MKCPRCEWELRGVERRRKDKPCYRLAVCDACRWESAPYEQLIERSPEYRLAKLKAANAEPGRRCDMSNHPPEIEALYREHGELTERLFCSDDGADEDWRRLEAVRAALHAYQERRAEAALEVPND